MTKTFLAAALLLAAGAAHAEDGFSLGIGADYSRGDYGTALHEAAIHGHREIVDLLLERGADLNLPNVHGDTVLTVVRKAQQGLVHPSNLPAHPEIEQLLVSRGARE